MDPTCIIDKLNKTLEHAPGLINGPLYSSKLICFYNFFFVMLFYFVGFVQLFDNINIIIIWPYAFFLCIKLL